MKFDFVKRSLQRELPLAVSNLRMGKIRFASELVR